MYMIWLFIYWTSYQWCLHNLHNSRQEAETQTQKCKGDIRIDYNTRNSAK